MHIVVLYQHYLRHGEAGHSRVNEFARQWVRMGHQVTVLTGQTSYMEGIKLPEYNYRLAVREEDQGVTVYRCFVPGNYNRSYFHRAFSYFAFAFSSALVSWRLRQPSVMLVSSPPLTIGIAALVILLFRKIPMVFEVRDLWPESAITTGILKSRSMIKFLSWLEVRCYRAATALNTLTPAFKENIVARGLMPADRVANIQAGVDLEEMHPSKVNPALRATYGWGDRKVVLYTGAIGRANRLGQLVETAALLKDRPEILIAVVGSGMEEEQLKSEAKARGLTNIIFHGHRPKEAMPEIVATADICAAVLMKNDTFKTVYPNKVFDYMACAKPILLGIDGVIRELVEREQAGLFAEPENPAALKAAILRLVDDPTLAKSQGERGRQFVEREFSRDRMAQQFVDLFENVLQRGRP